MGRLPCSLLAASGGAAQPPLWDAVATVVPIIRPAFGSNIATGHQRGLPPPRPRLASSSEQGTKTSPPQFYPDLQGFRSSDGSHHSPAVDTARIAHPPGTGPAGDLSQSGESDPAEQATQAD